MATLHSPLMQSPPVPVAQQQHQPSGRRRDSPSPSNCLSSSSPLTKNFPSARTSKPSPITFLLSHSTSSPHSNPEPSPSRLSQPGTPLRSNLCTSQPQSCRLHTASSPISCTLSNGSHFSRSRSSRRSSTGGSTTSNRTTSSGNCKGSSICSSSRSNGSSSVSLRSSLRGPKDPLASKGSLRPCNSSSGSSSYGPYGPYGTPGGEASGTRLDAKAAELNAKQEEDMRKAREMLLSPFTTARRLWVLMAERRMDVRLIRFPTLKEIVNVTLLTFVAVVVSAVALSITDSVLKRVASFVFRT